jgi:hypothetical protein
MTAPVTMSQPKGETIAMTAPVTQSGADGAWTVRFFMPKGATVESLPTPNDKRVRLITIPSSRVALVRFSGLTPDKVVAARTQGLKELLASYGFQPIGPPSLARYDPPWTLWFLRRNEIWIPIAAAAE